ncbi:ABC transporter ATP-binding protein [Bacillus sp. 165]|uniref:ABC transporter ATP-binding protein n=1 Tax=Bacillus sp. 165 TaxID=1529117 RepID=UPI001AD97EAB|nr:ABC transporter ATP-binding protein [Bacillus sp. 165]MBO9130682.1 ABC transporter ATP-binding protein [Bacillus sp. 165]
MLKLFRNLKPFTGLIAVVVTFVFIQSMGDLYLPTLMSDIIDTGVIKGDTDYILKIGAFMLLVAAGGAVCAVFASYFSSKAAMGFGRNLRNKVFSRVESFSLQEFDTVGTASLITRTTNDITQVQQVLMMLMRMVISAPIMFVGGVIMAVTKDAKLSLIIVAIAPILVLTIFLIMFKALPLFKAMQIKIDKLNLILRESLTGVRVVRAFNRDPYEQTRFEKANYDLMDVSIKVNKIMAFMMPMMMLILNLTTVGVLWFGGIRIDTGHMQIGDLMAFMQYVAQIMFALIMASMMFIMVPRASASAARINAVLDMNPSISDAAVTTTAEANRGYLEFDSVTFSYPGAEMPALSNISFRAAPGQVTAVIGGTGSGKSTMVNLIPRFYDIDAGTIRVNGIDVRKMKQKELRSYIGLVPQKAVLFSGTISENIRYGKENATDEEVWHAAKVAQAADFIEGMKEGYDSQITQGGTNLSGGQKQRLSIARALVRKPDLYILDDSFSALDFKTDAKLRAALKKETQEATVLIVAQRVSTVRAADQIIVLDEGKIEGIGTHEQLLETCSVYREIVQSQLSEEEIA